MTTARREIGFVAWTGWVYMFALCGFTLLATPGCQRDKPPEFSDLVAAVALARQGQDEDALVQLSAIAERADGTLAQEAHLAAGNLLLRQRLPADAAAYLESAVDGPEPTLRPYAEILFARALNDAGLSPDRVRTLADDLFTANCAREIREEAGLLRVEARRSLGEHAGAIKVGEEYLERFSEGASRNRVRWCIAESTERDGRLQEALDRYEEVWYETPESPYALDARRAAASLLERHDLSRRRLSAKQHLAFIGLVQKAGRHREALEEIDALRRRFPNHPGKDELLYRETVSAHATRMNTRAIDAANKIWTGWRGSKWTPLALLNAIKCERRADNTKEVRRLCRRLADNYKSHRNAHAARLNLASYLMNTGFSASSPSDREALLQESRAAFDELIARAGDRPIVRDGLWRRAWLEIRDGRPVDGGAWIDKLLERFPDTGYRSAGLFWSGKLLLGEGQESAAIERWTTLVRDAPYTYYGYRAQELLQGLGHDPGPIGSDAIFPAVDRLDSPTGRPNYDAALRLKSLGLYEFAIPELLADGADEGDLGRRYALIDLRAANGQNRAAVRELTRHFKTFIQAGGQGLPTSFWQILYPLHHWSVIRREAEERGLDPWVVAALIRNESLFDPHATSAIGAIGLTQLLEETAVGIAEELNLPAPSNADLHDPELNIRFGTYYLAKRVQGFDGDMVLALCSYNAGLTAAKRWQKSITAEDPDKWIDLIPYKDTRLYIKKVLRDLRQYRRIYADEAGT